MKDETALRLIVADCVVDELRWTNAEPEALIDLDRLSDRIADEVIRRLRAAGMKVTS
jgi:hypothetical protein